MVHADDVIRRLERDVFPKIGALQIGELTQLRAMIIAAEEDYARPITRLGLRFLALTAVRSSDLRDARWNEFEELNGEAPSWRIPAARMKGDLDRKGEIGGDHLVLRRRWRRWQSRY